MTVALKTLYVITVRKSGTLQRSTELLKITEKGVGEVKAQNEHTSSAE